MRTLITAGPTREPIDAVRFIGNRSSGRMGAALTRAALEAGDEVTLIVGPVCTPMPGACRRIDIETAQQLHDAVHQQFPQHDLLIMAAAVADYRPRRIVPGKLPRTDALVIECEATPDILQSLIEFKRPGQRIVGFSLEAGGIERAREKLQRKRLDLMVYNPVETMESESIQPVLLAADGRSESFAPESKEAFARVIVARAHGLFTGA